MVFLIEDCYKLMHVKATVNINIRKLIKNI